MHFIPYLCIFGEIFQLETHFFFMFVHSLLICYTQVWTVTNVIYTYYYSPSKKNKKQKPTVFKVRPLCVYNNVNLRKLIFGKSQCFCGNNEAYNHLTCNKSLFTIHRHTHLVRYGVLLWVTVSHTYWHTFFPLFTGFTL